MMSLISWMMRLGCARSDRKRDRGLMVPQGLILHKNIPYGPHKDQLLDIYLPEKHEKALPVIVSVHGGGWVYGDKELYSHYCMDLATRGFAVVNYTYRLSPAHKFPCHLEDTVLAFRWVLTQGKVYGLDLNNIFAVGDSAGGHILALYCCLCTNSRYAGTYQFAPQAGFAPKAVALNCGVYDLIAAKSTASGTLRLMKDVLGHTASDEELRNISPAFHVETGFPPCYIMTANEDFLKEQAPCICAALEAKQVPYEYHCYGSETEKLGHVFHLDIRSGAAIYCNDEECTFFRRQTEDPHD